MYEYNFFRLDISRPNMEHVNKMAAEGWRIISVAPDGVRALLLFERSVNEVTVTKAVPQKCAGKKSDGEPCGAYAVTGSEYCIAHQDQADE